MEYFVQSANKGNIDALNNIGDLYYYLKAADRGSEYAVNSIGNIYEKVYVINQDSFSIHGYYPFFINP